LRLIETDDESHAGDTAMQALAPGAHIVSPRRGYLHHGIYAGNGRVIHYAGFSRALRRGPVEEVPLERFTRGRGLAARPWAAPKYSGEAIVERARSRLGEDRYRLWSNNCEHFVAWCISGAHHSAQVDAWRTRLRRCLDAIGALIGKPARNGLRTSGAPQAAQ
jgi:hypothetical protein